MKKSKNKELFEREQKRLERLIEKGTKAGYIYPEDIIPPMPKRVTQQAIENISKVRPKDLLAMANYLDTETGELIPAEQHQQMLKAGTGKGKTKTEQIEVKPIKVKEEKLKPKKEKKKKEKPKTEKKKKPIEEKKKEENGEQKERRTRGKDKKPRKKRERKETPQKYIPTIDILDIVHDRIAELERKTYPYVRIQERKQGLLNILDDSITFYSENLDEYRDYLKEKQERIFDLCQAIEYESGGKGAEDTISASFIELARILNVTPLSMSQAEGVSFMSEVISD